MNVKGIRTIIYPVKDIAEAKTLYGRLLSVDPYMDEPYYVGFRIGDQEIGLDPNGYKQGLAGPLSYWQVDDIKTSVQLLLDAGARIHKDVKDVGGGKLIAIVKDASDNLIGLMQLPD